MGREEWFSVFLQMMVRHEISDLTSSYQQWSLGTEAREIIQKNHRCCHGQRSFNSARASNRIGPLRVLASRISYVGDLGWEFYIPIEQGAKLWQMIWESGKKHEMIPVGIGVYGTTGRLEKCYRAYGPELETEYTVIEAGMQSPKLKEADFIGKQAHVKHRSEAPVSLLCTLFVDDHTSANGEKRYMMVN